jgi:hypothetical protein
LEGWTDHGETQTVSQVTAQRLLQNNDGFDLQLSNRSAESGPQRRIRASLKDMPGLREFLEHLQKDGFLNRVTSGGYNTVKRAEKRARVSAPENAPDRGDFPIFHDSTDGVNLFPAKPEQRSNPCSLPNV